MLNLTLSDRLELLRKRAAQLTVAQQADFLRGILEAAQRRVGDMQCRLDDEEAAAVVETVESALYGVELAALRREYPAEYRRRTHGGYCDCADCGLDRERDNDIDLDAETQPQEAQ